MLYKQIPFEKWDEVASPEFIAILPYYAEEMQNLYGLNFDCIDENLGECLNAYIQIHEVYFSLSAYINETGIKRYVGVEVRSFEPDSSKALEFILNGLNIKNSDLIWVSDFLGERKWVVKKVDERGSEIELSRFLNEESANWFSYKNKGTKVVKE